MCQNHNVICDGPDANIVLQELKCCCLDGHGKYLGMHKHLLCLQSHSVLRPIWFNKDGLWRSHSGTLLFSMFPKLKEVQEY